MKKLLILVSLCLSLSCTESPEETQEYTSFVLLVKEGATNLIQPRIGYFNEAGKCILIKEFDSFENNIYTDEIILSEDQKELFLFYFRGVDIYTYLEKSFIPKKNKKNIFIIEGRGINIPEVNEYTWPH